MRIIHGFSAITYQQNIGGENENTQFLFQWFLHFFFFFM